MDSYSIFAIHLVTHVYIVSDKFVLFATLSILAKTAHDFREPRAEGRGAAELSEH